MMDIDILPVQRLDFRVFPLPWPFAADRRTEIEDYFTHLRREKPQLWNGRVLLLRDFEISDATLQGTMFETDYASFIAWRDWGFPTGTSARASRWGRCYPAMVRSCWAS